MQRLRTLPPNTFLTINLETSQLTDPTVLDTLTRHGRLDRLFLELTEHTVIGDLEDLLSAMTVMRALGARIAVDDAGSGYAGLALLLSLRPELIKLDRELVSGIDVDPVKRVLVRALGELASSIDAWVLAEGVETAAEVDELVALEVPLGQGWAFGRPAPTFADEVPFDVVETIARRVARREHPRQAVALLDDVARVEHHLPPVPGPIRIVVDGLGRPIAVDPGDGSRDEHPLIAHPSEQLTTLARRAAARPAPRWASPVVLVDGRGVAAGIVEVRRLLEGAADVVEGTSGRR